MQEQIVNLVGALPIYSGYGGDVKKYAVEYNRQSYMLKTSQRYKNDAISEHLGCRIFAMLGIPVQETFLCYYSKTDEPPELVVACKNFREDKSIQLCTGDTLSKWFITHKDAHCPELKDIEKIFNKYQADDTGDIRQRFWETFVVDALIGNRSRHLDDWGFLSRELRHMTMAPVYDCGRSLGVYEDEKLMLECLADPQVMYDNECQILTNFKVNGKRVTYADMLLNPSLALVKAMETIVPRINFNDIYALVDSVPVLTKVRNKFIKESITMRYEKLLLPAINKIVLAKGK